MRSNMFDPSTTSTFALWGLYFSYTMGMSHSDIMSFGPCVLSRHTRYPLVSSVDMLSLPSAFELTPFVSNLCAQSLHTKNRFKVEDNDTWILGVFDPIVIITTAPRVNPNQNHICRQRGKWYGCCSFCFPFVVAVVFCLFLVKLNWS